MRVSYVPPMRFGYSNATESQHERQQLSRSRHPLWRVGRTEQRVKRLPGLTRRAMPSPDTLA